jgi:hypothetical protein
MGSASAVTSSRTEAGAIAHALDRRLGPLDVIVYCPDQLAPAVSRLVPSSVRQITFPEQPTVSRIDWTDYRHRVAESDPVDFALRVDALAAENDIWLVVAPRYITVGAPCHDVQLVLQRLRTPSTIVSFSGPEREGSTLERLRR